MTGGRGISEVRPASFGELSDLIAAMGTRSGPAPVLSRAAQAPSARVHTSPSRRLTIFPTLNEESGLAATLEDYCRVHFGRAGARPTVLVVDGHSVDRTLRVAQSWGVEILTQTGSGKGAALKEGLAWARDRGFEQVAVLDADRTYPCEALPALFELLESGSELVVGVRRPEEDASLRELVHRCGNGLLNCTASTLTRAPILDVCSGFWGIQSRVASELPLESTGFDIEAELFIRAFRAGYAVSQLPIVYRKRIGTAKLHTVRDGARIFWSILRHSLRARSDRLDRAEPGASTSVAAGAAFRTLLSSLAPDRLVVLSDRDRAQEAEQVASDLAYARPEAEVLRAVMTAPERYLVQGASSSGLGTTSTELGSQLFIVLPPASDMDGAPDRMLVGIPGTRRVFDVASRAGHTGKIPRPKDSVPGHFRSPIVGPALTNLWSTLDPRANHEISRFLGANFPEADPRGDPASQPGFQDSLA